MRRGPTITAIYVPHILRAARAAGVDTAALSLRLALPASPAYEDRLPIRRLFDLWEAVVAATDDGIPARAAAAIDPGNELSLLNLCGQSVRTVRDAMTTLTRYWPTGTDAYRWTGEARGAAFALVCDETRWLGRAGWRAHLEYDVVDIVNVCRRNTGGAMQPTRVSFAHRPPRNVASHAAALGVAPRFSAERTELLYPRGVLDLPPIATRPALAAALEALLAAQLERARRGRRASAEVHEVLPALLRAGRATAADAARRLDVGLRTLGRRLAAEGSSFREILVETRRALAGEWLRVVPIADVAERLGYADTRAFDRAFKGWTGSTPSAWRRRAAAR